MYVHTYITIRDSNVSHVRNCETWTETNWILFSALLYDSVSLFVILIYRIDREQKLVLY